MKKIAKKLARFISLKIYLPLVYRLAARKPVDPENILFLEISADHLTDAFSLLYEQVQQRGHKPGVIYLHDGSVGGMQYLCNCRQMLRQIATAAVVFINEASNITSCVKMRPETQLIQTWHGCGAFKKFGFSTANLGWGITGKEMERYPYYRNQSLVTVSAESVIPAYQDAMHQPPGVIQATGVSRTDVFFDEAYIKASYEKLYEHMPQAKGKQVILYAPTFRGTQKEATSPQLDIAAFAKALGDRYVLVEKHHPFVRQRPPINPSYAWFAGDLTEDMSIQQLLCVADLCISDYSSLVFEYSLFLRPMLFFAFDLEQYFDQRGFYFDYHTLTPGRVFTENAQLIAYIEEEVAEFDDTEVRAFRDRFMSACDGASTERILNRIGL